MKISCLTFSYSLDQHQIIQFHAYIRKHRPIEFFHLPYRVYKPIVEGAQKMGIETTSYRSDIQVVNSADLLIFFGRPKEFRKNPHRQRLFHLAKAVHYLFPQHEKRTPLWLQPLETKRRTM